MVYLDKERIKMIKDKYTEFTSTQNPGKTEFYDMDSMGTSSTPAAGGMGGASTAITQMG